MLEADRAGQKMTMSGSTRQALLALLHPLGDEPSFDLQIRAAARLVAADARQQGLSPEAMLVLLKHSWHSMDSGVPVTSQSDLLEPLVTLTIRAYYAASGNESPPTAVPDPGAPL
jgi:hypothetical protein